MWDLVAGMLMGGILEMYWAATHERFFCWWVGGKWLLVVVVVFAAPSTAKNVNPIRETRSLALGKKAGLALSKRQDQ